MGHFVQFYRKICLFFFLEFPVIQMFVKNLIFVLQILEKQLHVFAQSTLHKLRQMLSYMWKFSWEKDTGERKVHNPIKQSTFYHYRQRFTVLHPPKICMKCCLLMNTASKRNIQHRISLKTYGNWCPYDNHSYRTCERIAKLNKEALGKIKNTNKNDRRGCASLLKFDQLILRRRQTNLQQGGEKLNYDMLTLIFNMKFILIPRGVSWAVTV